MKELNRDNLLVFLADLASPIGPEVFAGYGSELQNKRHEDPDYGDKAKSDWVKSVNTQSALEILFEIACNPPDANFINNFYFRFQESWIYELTDLIFLVGKKDRLNLLVNLKKHSNNENARVIISEVNIWLNEENA